MSRKCWRCRLQYWNLHFFNSLRVDFSGSEVYDCMIARFCCCGYLRHAKQITQNNRILNCYRALSYASHCSPSVALYLLDSCTSLLGEQGAQRVLLMTRCQARFLLSALSGCGDRRTLYSLRQVKIYIFNESEVILSLLSLLLLLPNTTISTITHHIARFQLR